MLDLHVLVDDPGLAAHLRDDPAGLHRDDGQHPEAAAIRRNHLPWVCRGGSPTTARTRATQAAGASRVRPSRPMQDGQCSPDVWWASWGGTVSRPCTTVAVPVLGSDNHDAQAGDRDPACDRPVVVQPAQQRLGHVTRRGRHELDRRELDRLVVVDPPSEANRPPPSGSASSPRPP